MLELMKRNRTVQVISHTDESSSMRRERIIKNDSCRAVPLILLFGVVGMVFNASKRKSESEQKEGIG